MNGVTHYTVPKEGQTDSTRHLLETLVFELGFEGKVGAR